MLTGGAQDKTDSKRADNTFVGNGSADAGSGREVLRAFRATSLDDIKRLRGLALEYHAESRYSHIPFSDEKFFKIYSRLVGKPSGLSVYVQLGDQPVGLLGAEIGDYFLGQGERIATTYVVYVSQKIRGTMLGGKVSIKLLRMFSDWAKSQGADELNIHATSGIEPEHTDRFLKKLGFTAYGGNYAARV